jgi:RES domain-containing protein
LEYYRLIENLPGRSPLGFGLGAGRWNEYGTPLIYACNQISLNFLELLSIKGSIVSKASWYLVTLEISGEIPFLNPLDFPADWRRRPHPVSTQKIGNFWAKQMGSTALKIPSCRIPESTYPNEHNLLINPLHPDFIQNVKFISQEEVNFEINI